MSVDFIQFDEEEKKPDVFVAKFYVFFTLFSLLLSSQLLLFL